MSGSALRKEKAVVGRFGPYGGRYVPETLMAALEELEAAYAEAQADAAFKAELDDLLRNYCGRPTPLYFAKRLSEQLSGAKIYLKREDLLHTGAHKINNALGQALLNDGQFDAALKEYKDLAAADTEDAGALVKIEIGRAHV